MEGREEIKKYSLEWYKEMRKLNKDTIISLVESNGKQRDNLKDQNKSLLDEIERLKFQLKSADSVNEWISVEDRLPLDYVPYSYTETNYLIYIELPTGFRIEMAEWFTSDCEELKSYFIPIKSHYGYDYKITHWMPLPNKPKTN